MEAEMSSHPVWVRGLKHRPGEIVIIDTLSHPVWVRGLKQRQIDNVDAEIEVAPRVGAWIETIKSYLSIRSLIVAPRVGAWIETR